MRLAVRVAGRPRARRNGNRSSPSLSSVSYDHFSGDRFRHGTRLMRWRPDKAPKQCTMDQVAQKKADLMKLLK